MLAYLPQSGYAPGQTTSNQKPGQTTTAFSAGTAPGLMQLQAPAWSTYGRLFDTKMQREDGQPIYALQDGQGRTLSYVTTNPDKSLVSYLGRIVSVYGPKMYRPESATKIEYIVASHVAVP